MHFGGGSIGDCTNQHDEFEPHQDGCGLCIEHVLSVPIESRSDAENFLRQWWWDGFGYPLHDNMFEIRTILAPERFVLLQERLRELADNSFWQQEARDPDMYYREGAVIEGLLADIELEANQLELDCQSDLDSSAEMMTPAGSTLEQACDDAPNEDEADDISLSGVSTVLYDAWGRVLRG